MLLHTCECQGATNLQHAVCKVLRVHCVRGAVCGVVQHAAAWSTWGGSWVTLRAHGSVDANFRTLAAAVQQAAAGAATAATMSVTTPHPCMRNKPVTNLLPSIGGCSEQ